MVCCWGLRTNSRQEKDWGSFSACRSPGMTTNIRRGLNSLLLLEEGWLNSSPATFKNSSRLQVRLLHITRAAAPIKMSPDNVPTDPWVDLRGAAGNWNMMYDEWEDSKNTPPPHPEPTAEQFARTAVQRKSSKQLQSLMCVSIWPH